MTQKEIEAKQKEINLANFTYVKFKEAMINKSSLTAEWRKYLDAYSGDYFKNANIPEYKSNQVSNFIFSTVETIRPIMSDNNPRFIAMARNLEGMEKTPKVQTALDYEWDREKMSIKLPRSLITTLVLGTSVFGLFWDGKANKHGEIKCKQIDPFNLFPDPLATCIEDAEYIIYASYKHVNQLKKLFPAKANLLDGGDIKYEELVANRKRDARVDNQVLVLEMWTRDYTTIDVEEYDEKTGTTIKKKKRQYPRGRVITTAPELQLVLSDKENPYKDGRFPFILIKDYDIPFKFWGEGEVKQLLSPQIYINELSNQIIDNAKQTANMPWIIDKNAGIGYGKLTNRPGLVIRKNPGTDVRREQPPSMPQYVEEKIASLKTDMEQISGIFDSVKGNRTTGVVAAQAIMALQEANQARIRIKVKLMEDSLGELATMWYKRMQQFWVLDRWVRVVKPDGDYDFEKIQSEDLEYDFDVKVTAGSTMPVNKNAMLDMMIRLGQTQAEDGLPMVDRKAVLEFVPIPDKQAIIKRFDEKVQSNEQITQQEQMLQEVQTILQDLIKEIKGMNEDIARIDKKQQRVLEENRILKAKLMGYNKGISEGKAMLDEEYLFNEDEFIDPLEQQAIEEEIMLSQMDGELEEFNQMELPDEALEALEEMSDEELMQLLEEYPELEDILASNRM